MINQMNESVQVPLVIGKTDLGRGSVRLEFSTGARAGLPEEVTFEQRTEGAEGGATGLWGRRFLGREYQAEKTARAKALRQDSVG